jgi:hypothetical protein
VQRREPSEFQSNIQSTSTMSNEEYAISSRKMASIDTSVRDASLNTREEFKDAPMGEALSEQTAQTERQRPKLDLNVSSKERKRGKSMFGLVLGTLKKAKLEDKERNASDAVR